MEATDVKNKSGNYTCIIWAKTEMLLEKMCCFSLVKLHHSNTAAENDEREQSRAEPTLQKLISNVFTEGLSQWLIQDTPERRIVLRADKITRPVSILWTIKFGKTKNPLQGQLVIRNLKKSHSLMPFSDQIQNLNREKRNCSPCFKCDHVWNVFTANWKS